MSILSGAGLGRRIGLMTSIADTSRLLFAARIALARILIVDLASKFFQRATFSFRFQNFSFERSRPRRFAASLFFTSGNLRASHRALSIFDCIEQTLSRELAIHRLRTGILSRYADAAGSMPQRYRSGDFVYVLTAGTTRPREPFFKIDLANAEPCHPLRVRVRCHLLDKIDELGE
jgi:hypothetical protein